MSRYWHTLAQWINGSVMPDWINQWDSVLLGQSYSRIAEAGANHIHSRSELINYSFKSATLTSADVVCKGRQTNVWHRTSRRGHQ